MLEEPAQETEALKMQFISTKITKLKYNMIFNCKEEYVKNSLSFFILDNPVLT